MSAEELARALRTLGLKPDASADEVVARVVAIMSAIEACWGAGLLGAIARPLRNRAAA